MCSEIKAKARNLFKQGFTITEISTKLDVPVGTLKGWSTKEKWTEQRNQFQTKLNQKTEEKTIEKVSERLSDRNARHIELWDLFLDKVELAIKAKFIKETTRDGEVEYIDFKPSDLANISNALEKAQKGHRLAEGLDKEGSKDNSGGTIDDLANAIKESAKLYEME